MTIITNPATAAALDSAQDRIRAAVELRTAQSEEFAVGIALLDLEQRAIRSLTDRGIAFPLDLHPTDPMIATLDLCAALIPIADVDGQRTLREVQAFYRPNLLRARRITVDTNSLRLTLDGLVRAWSRGNTVGVDLLLRRALGILSAPLIRS